MQYRLREIIESLPKEKAKQDGIWTRFILRPVSFPVAALALRCGLGAKAVSYFSAILSVAGGVLFSFPGFLLPLIGAILLNIFSVLDCVDGNMARVTGTAGAEGGWADAASGFIAYTSVFFGTGLYLYWRTECWPVLVIAGLTSSANLLTRVFYQMYKNIVGESAHGQVSFERRLAENVGITGFLMPLIFIFHICNFLPGMWFILWFNAAFYGGGCLITFVKTAYKVGRNAP